MLLTEVVGEIQAQPARLGPLVQSLGTLVLLPPASPASLTELSARATLLRRRFRSWREQARESLRNVPAAVAPEGQIETLVAVLEGERFQAADAAVAALRGIRIMPQVTQAMGGLPPVAPGGESVPSSPAQTTPDPVERTRSPAP